MAYGWLESWYMKAWSRRIWCVYAELTEGGRRRVTRNDKNQQNSYGYMKRGGVGKAKLIKMNNKALADNCMRKKEGKISQKSKRNEYTHFPTGCCMRRRTATMKKWKIMNISLIWINLQLKWRARNVMVRKAQKAHEQKLRNNVSSSVIRGL